MAGKQFNIGRITSIINRRFDDARNKAADALEQAVREGRDQMLQTIVHATTPTGLARAGRGGLPGRIDSGQMYNDVGYEIERKGKYEIIGRWGWTKDSQRYYQYQEGGTKRLAGMNALGGSIIYTSQRLRARLKGVGR